MNNNPLIDIWLCNAKQRDKETKILKIREQQKSYRKRNKDFKKTWGDYNNLLNIDVKLFEYNDFVDLY